MTNIVGIAAGLGGGVVTGAVSYFIAFNMLGSLYGTNTLDGMPSLWGTVLIFIPIAVLALTAAIVIRIFG